MSGVVLGPLVGNNQYQQLTERQKIFALNLLIEQWREPQLVVVRPNLVIPCTTNREHTGLSAVHVHYIASQMQEGGFKKRRRDGSGHDMPVLVRESVRAPSDLGIESLRKWSRSCETQPHFPPVASHVTTALHSDRYSTGGSLFQQLNTDRSVALPGIDPDATNGSHNAASAGATAATTGCAVSGGSSFQSSNVRSHAGASSKASPRARTNLQEACFFCSLGNGHFFQALNLFGSRHPKMFDSAVDGDDIVVAAAKDAASRGVTGDRDATSDAAVSAASSASVKTAISEGRPRYSADGDALLREALDVGVEALVLRADMPKAERKFVSLMLNSTFEYRWTVGSDGSVRVDGSDEFRRFTSFDGLTKHADSFQLDEIVSLKLKREADKRKKTRELAALLEERKIRQRRAAERLKRSRL